MSNNAGELVSSSRITQVPQSLKRPKNNTANSGRYFFNLLCTATAGARLTTLATLNDAYPLVFFLQMPFP